MTVKVYVGILSTIVMSIWFTPDWNEMFKVYVVTTVAIVTFIVGVLFHISSIREKVVNHLVAAVLQEILKDRDIQKLINWGTRRDELYKRIKQKIDDAKTKK